MIVRQSDLKKWNECPLKVKYMYLDDLPREQSGSLTFGSILHDCIHWMETQIEMLVAKAHIEARQASAQELNDILKQTIVRFQEFWIQPTLLDPTYQPQYYVRGTSWKSFMERGPKVLEGWFGVASWDENVALGREHEFRVPIGDGHTLWGTVDKVEVGYVGEVDGYAVKIVDYKTDKKVPTYGYLAEDLQFSAYAYASLQPEFWENIGGQEAYERFKDLPRVGEWVQLTGPKRMSAGERTQRHYNRLVMAVNAYAESFAMRIFVPTISGESCRYCEYRGPCGLPELDDDGNERRDEWHTARPSS